MWFGSISACASGDILLKVPAKTLKFYPKNLSNVAQTLNIDIQLQSDLIPCDNLIYNRI